MVELDRSNSNTTESVASSEEWSQEWSDEFPEYDDTTIKFNRYDTLSTSSGKPCKPCKPQVWHHYQG